MLKLILKHWESILMFVVVSTFISVRANAVFEYRRVSYDEQFYSNSAISVAKADEIFTVPNAYSWGHIYPEFKKVSFHPPLTFLIHGYLFRLFGVSPIVIGVFSTAITLLSLLIFYQILRLANLPLLVKWLLLMFFVVLAWSGIEHLGRPENLQILILTIVAYQIEKWRQNNSVNNIKVIGLGILIGIGTLLHLGFFVPGLVVLFGTLFDEFNLKKSTIRYGVLALIGVVSGACLWLIWWLPYHETNLIIWRDFILPNQLHDPIDSTLMRLRRLVYMQNSFEFTLTGLLTFFAQTNIFLVALFAWAGIRSRTKRKFVLLIVLIIGYFIMLARNQPLIYPIKLLATVLLLFLPILLQKIEWGNLFRYPVFVTIAGFASVQFLAIILFSMLTLVGNTLVRVKNDETYQVLFKSIEPSEIVMTNNGYAMYKLLDTNLVYWPAGLGGVIDGAVRYETNYDDSFTYLLLTKPLEEINIIDTETPGVKFPWDNETLEYFMSNYELIGAREYSLTGLERFSSIPRSLYLYRYATNE